MPAFPPVTDGLSVWLCSDTNVDFQLDGTVVSWGAADIEGVRAAAIGSSRPQWLEDQINGYPVLRFEGAQGLFLEMGVIAQNSFTLVVVGRSLDQRQQGGEGLPGQKMVFYQDGSETLTHAAVSVGWNGVGVYEFGASGYPRAEAEADAACFCPLVVRYENQALSVWLTGDNVISDESTPSQPVNAPHGIGGPGGGIGGFAGDIAEVLIYNRALSEWERHQVEQYVQNKYACGPSSSSSASSEMSSWSSQWSSEWSSEQSSSSSSERSSEQSSEQSSSQESSWSSQESSWSSAWSSEQSSAQSSEQSSAESSSSSSSCSCEMPSDPVPVTEGLVAWQRSDLNVNQDFDGISTWGPVCHCLPDMVRAGTLGPQIVENSFGTWPGLEFTEGQMQQLTLQSGALGVNNFTLFVVARPEAERVWNGSGVAGQRMLLSDDGGVGSANADVSAGTQSLGLYELEYVSSPRLEAWMAGCLCPLVVRYENKQAALYVSGALVAQDSAAPWYDVFIPHNLGGWINNDPTAGFVGEVAEVLFYNRALSDYERELVEQYVQNRYGCQSSSSSASSEVSSWSSQQSSQWSSEQSSEWSSQQSSWQSSAQSSAQSSSQESSWSSARSSEQSSMHSSMEPSSSCSPVLPPDPVPVTDGLVAWQRADTNVSLNVNNQVTIWGGADGCLPDAVWATYAAPGWQAASFGVQPAVVFTGAEGLLLELAGELGANSFTLVVAACSDLLWEPGSLFAPDSSQTGAVAAVAASMGQVTLSEPGGSGSTRLSASVQGCLCPLTVIYDNKQARIYWQGQLVAQDSSTPAYMVWLPKLIGGTGSGGFVGRVAEVLFYNRALGDSERQQVEGYLQDRYQCLSSESSGQSSSGQSSSEESSSMSSASVQSSSSSSSHSSETSHGSSSISSSSESTSSALSIEGPSRIGVTTPQADRSKEVTVTTNNGNPNNIQLSATQGADKVTIEALGVISESSAKFKVTGTTASSTEADVTLEAICEGITATKTLTVVIPAAVGSPRPLNQEFNVQATPLAQNSTTTPPMQGVNPPKKFLSVFAMTTLVVQIKDQFGEDLRGYSGAAVTESLDQGGFTSINQNLSTLGQYSDPVGLGAPAPNPPYSENPTDNQNTINQWLNTQPSGPSSGHKTRTIRIKIDDTWELDAGTRDLLLKDAETLQINWP